MTDRPAPPPPDQPAELAGGWPTRSAALEASSPRSSCSSPRPGPRPTRHEARRAAAAEKLATRHGGRGASGSDPRAGSRRGPQRPARDCSPAGGADGGPGRRPRGQAPGPRPLPRRAARTYVRGARRAFGDVAPPARRRPGGRRAPTPTRAVAPPAVSRLLLAAQEDLRREIARAMHDGPAQSLTNIVLQAQIVERLVDTRPGQGRAARSASSWRWSSRRSTRPSRSSSTSGRWSSTTSASCRPCGARRATAAGGPASRSSSTRWARTAACRWTSRAACSGSSTRRWRPTSAPGADRVSLAARLVRRASRRASRASRGAAPETRPDPTPDEARRRRGPAAGARRDDGGAPRRRARRGRGRPARGDRRAAAGDLARDPEPAPRRSASPPSCRPTAPSSAWSADAAAAVRRPSPSACRWRGRASGQGLVEYGLILALTSVVHGRSSSCVFGGTARRHPGRDRRRHRRGHRRADGAPTVRTPRPVPSALVRFRDAAPYIGAALDSGVSTHPGGSHMALFNDLYPSLTLRPRRGRPGSRGVRADPRPHRDRRDHRPHLPGRPGQHDPEHGRQLGLGPTPSEVTTAGPSGSGGRV